MPLLHIQLIRYAGVLCTEGCNYGPSVHDGWFVHWETIRGEHWLWKLSPLEECGTCGLYAIGCNPIF